MFYKTTYVLLLMITTTLAENSCMKFDVTITQKIENEGFHREMKWIIELATPSPSKLEELKCKILMQLDVPHGMFVNPDEISEMNRAGSLSAYIDGEVNIETPLHESTEHTAFVFIPKENMTEKMLVNLPVHLRYQRAQITGGFGKVHLQKPSFLVNCTEKVPICGRGVRVGAPCDVSAKEICLWKNVTYNALFEDVELFVPIGDLDDYPLVSIVSLLLGCAGCIYVLSILSTAPL